MKGMVFRDTDSMWISLKWYKSDNITMESKNHPPQYYATMDVPLTVEYRHWEKTERRDSRERNGRWILTEMGLETASRKIH